MTLPASTLVRQTIILGLCLCAAVASTAARAGDCPECETLLDRAFEQQVQELRAAHPELDISDELVNALLAAWDEAMTTETQRCPSPGDFEGAASRPFFDAPPLELTDTIPEDDTVTTFVQVFVDADSSGTFDAGELGLESVQVSNGTGAGPLGNGSALTNGGGAHTFTTHLWDSRYVFVTVPSGYRASTPFYHRLTSAANPDTAYFGLVEAPATADPNFRWVQMTDMQVANLLDEGLQNGDDLTEIESLSVPPDFIVVTGDLVQTGDQTVQFQNYLAGVFGHDSDIHHGYGDHDQNTGCLRVVNYEDFIDRPTCYSFEYGGVHFVMYNDIDANDAEGCFVQFPWLFLDLVTARARVSPAPLPIIICKHKLPGQDELNLYNLLGNTVGVFSGHWHGSRVREVQGIFDVNTAPSRYGGIDKTSRGFRIVDMMDGEVSTLNRDFGIFEELTITSPARDDTVLVEIVPVRVNAYSSTAVVQSAEFWVTGPVLTPPAPLTPDGPWSWSATWNSYGMTNGIYEMHVRVTPDIGVAYEDSVSFQLIQGGFVAQPDPFTDWPMYKYDAAGTGRSPFDIQTPLRLAWVKHLGSPVNVPSPAVSDGRVYIGTSNISTVGEAKMMCLDGQTGDVLWETPARNDVKSTPAVDDGLGSVFFTNSTGTLFSLDAQSGDVLWQTQLGDSLERWEMSSPTVHMGLVYAGGVSVMSAVDAVSGNIVWQEPGYLGDESDFIPSTYSAPAVTDYAAVFTSSRGIHAFEPLTGADLWSISASGNRVFRSAALVDSVAWTAGPFFGAQFLKGYDALTGDELFSGNSTLYESTAGPVVAPLAGGAEGEVRVIVPNGGNQSGTTGIPFHGRVQSFVPPGADHDWEFLLGDVITTSEPYKRGVTSINSTPAWVGDKVFFGSDDGFVYGVDAETGAELWKFDIGAPIRSSPAVAGNMLYVNSSDGTLYAFVSTTVQPAAAGPGASPGLRTRLIGNAPNPFNPSTTISFDLSAADATQDVRLNIYDPNGRLVRTLIDGRLESGSFAVAWDGRNQAGRPVASSVYFYELETASQSFQRKLVLLK